MLLGAVRMSKRWHQNLVRYLAALLPGVVASRMRLPVANTATRLKVRHQKEKTRTRRVGLLMPPKESMALLQQRLQPGWLNDCERISEYAKWNH